MKIKLDFTTESDNLILISLQWFKINKGSFGDG
jgi:hypothetical protein